MWVAMSRGMAVATLATTFATGGAAGWLLRDAAVASPATTSETPAPAAPHPTAPLSLSRTAARSKAGTAAPSPSAADPSAGIASVPTPGQWYRLTKSDTLSEVARRAYGSLARLSALERANPGLDAQRLRAGTLVYVPTASETAPPAPPPAPAPTKSASAKPPSKGTTSSRTPSPAAPTAK